MKIILSRSIVISGAAVLLSAAMALLVCGMPRFSLAEELMTDETGPTLTVEADKGLNLRVDASAAAAVVALIPSGSSVELLMVNPLKVAVSGKTGYWVNVKWNDKNGYVFSPYLKKAFSQWEFHSADKVAYAFHFAEGETGRYYLRKGQSEPPKYQKGTLTLFYPVPPMDEIITVLSDCKGDIEFVEDHATEVLFRIDKVTYQFGGGLNKYRIHGKLISVKSAGM